MKIGRVLGIDIHADGSWIFIVVLIFLSLVAFFGAKHPEAGALAVQPAALAATLLLFLSLLAHELAHSLVARRRGIQVLGITLFIFGGVSRMKNEPETPADELAISVVGPLMSGLLGGLFAAAAWALPGGTLVETAATWLATVNVVLAVFNLLPGFPLDGGRVLRSVIWWATGNRAAATRAAGTGGVALALGLIAVGLLTVFAAGAVIQGLWTAFIGWFLLSTAQSTRLQSEAQEVLKAATVGESELPPCPRVSPAEPIAGVVDRMRASGRRFYLVENGHGVEGVVTLRTVRRFPPDSPVESVMTPLAAMHRVTRADTLLRAMQEMDESAVDEVLVVDDGAIAGVLTREDLIRFLRVHLELRNGPRDSSA